ncbi:hypothetical protein [Streptacidiphilus melanogenes]|uniref:hypothetical protein n=1 Tax=Streptacidiphilus melanogenes TaxID=411235 RepID=UPI0005A64317|nr:hypothetical protein [Streptacidiphilus melanogenes]
MERSRGDAGFLQAGEDGGPDGDADGAAFPDWVLVRPDSRALVAPLLRSAPVIAIGTLRMGLLLARGRGTSPGEGLFGLVAGLVLVALPLLWVVLYIGMRWANAGIRLEDGELTVRNVWGRCVLRSQLSALTGLHTVALPYQGPSRHRVVVTSTAGKPLLIDPRLWDAASLKELWGALGVPFTEQGSLGWKGLLQRFPGVKVAWRHLHEVLFAVVVTIAGIAYIAVMVNLSYLV